MLTANMATALLGVTSAGLFVAGVTAGLTASAAVQAAFRSHQCRTCYTRCQDPPVRRLAHSLSLGLWSLGAAGVAVAVVFAQRAAARVYAGICAL